MFKSLLLSLAIVVSFSANAQEFEWARALSTNSTGNASLPGYDVVCDKYGNTVTSQIDGSHFNYGQHIYGNVLIHKRDPYGNPIWDFQLTDSVLVYSMKCDVWGNVYCMGSFLGTMHMNGPDSIVNSLGHWNEDYFILKIDPLGIFQWIRDVTPGAGYYQLRSIEVDPSGQLWYSTSDFSNSRLIKLDITGTPVDSADQIGANTISSFSFDPQGNILFCGSTDPGPFTFGGLTQTVTDSYSMYLGRYDAQMNGSWLLLARDITFSNPQVVADAFGDAYMAGPLYDSTQWGTTSLRRPQWTSDFYLLRVSSAGSVQWAVQSPLTSTIQGRMNVALNHSLSLDDQQHPVLFGTLNGTIDWGNNVIGNTGLLSLGMLHVVSFDQNGTALWQKTAGCQMGNYPASLSCGPTGETYVSGIITNAGQFDTITVNNTTNHQLYVLAKINSFSSAGISDLRNEALTAYPNPFTSELHVPTIRSAERFFLMDPTGRTVRTLEPNNTSLSGLGGLPAGNYLLKAENGSKAIPLIKGKD